MKTETKYIAYDCNGSALQFTGSGKSVQCVAGHADRFGSAEEAKAALKLAQESGGYVEDIDVVVADK